MKETKGEPDMNLREHILPKINVLNLIFISLKYLYTDFHVRSLFHKKPTSTFCYNSYIYPIFSAFSLHSIFRALFHNII